ncbi:AraC family transcriptional regulator [Pseudoduganella plicata]|uniref:Transcriptional regulator n=1 Tax=Pseudoduganella plicata TaxID=321984 RepID=A0A4P7BH86_9BURK|nr:AraC family transcriptional regulator [Pseudoduganella plicata]QBQ38114.1 AraC family transcriptional regulator [Pseudoduganella plicata]GGZ02842.1 transcriptional regulator [Pseudoduganella plicata]
MIDPLAEAVTLLQPHARFSKVVSAAGPWRVRRRELHQPFYCAILEGACLLQVPDHDPIALLQGDFVLVPSACGFTISGVAPPPAESADSVPTLLPNGEFRHGPVDARADVQMLLGYCTFDSPDAALLVSLLPQLVHVRGEPRLATLVCLVGDESRAERPAREEVLSRLLEVMLIEALRSAAGTVASPGLLRGLADERLAMALRRIHEDVARPWTVAQLAQEAALSRSAFFERFSRALGVAPMTYLLAWRMALAKRLLRQREAGIAAIAERVGYGSASAFSVAFARHVGLPPGRYLREQGAVSGKSRAPAPILR